MIKKVGLTFLLCMCVIAVFYSIKLYQNLRPNLEELLQSYTRSVTDLTKVNNRLRAIDNLAVVLFSDHTEASQRFALDLASRLQTNKNIVSSVEWGIQEELRFFNERKALFISTDDLLSIQKYIGDRIQYETDIRNPLNIFSGVIIPEPALNIQALRAKYEKRVSTYSDFPKGFFATPDEKIRALLIYPEGKSSDFFVVTKLRTYVDQVVNELNPTTYAPDLRVHYSGGIENIFEEQQRLIDDVELTGILATLLVGLALLSYFRNIKQVAALILTLVMATAWTFGIAYFLVGYLNANSAFLGSIILGNGINFPIILLARYQEERLRKNQKDALRGSIRGTMLPTLTAALGAGFSYGSLALTQFRGFHQFGIIGLLGMIMCWIHAFTIFPMLLSMIDKKNILPKPANIWNKLMGFVAAIVQRAPRTILCVGITISLAALALFSRLSPAILEADLTRLRSQKSMEQGSGYYSKFVDQIFKRYLAPIAILPDSNEKAEQIAAVLRKQQTTDSMIANVQTLSDFVPDDQIRKIRILKNIKELLSPDLLQQLSPSDRSLAHDFLRPDAFRPINQNDLPLLIKNKFTERDGTMGRLILVEPPLGSESLEREKLFRFVSNFRNTVDSVAPSTPVAGSLPISADVLQSIEKDGPKATIFAFIAVMLLIIALFRRPGAATLSAATLLIGILWLVGIILLFNIRINFLNFIALPITFGIGVDYGVNIVQRYRQEGRGKILSAVQSTGSAVTLCSATTIIGYSSLLLADNRAFVSFGTIAVLGEFTCLLTGTLLLPAYLYLRDKHTHI